MCLDAAEGGDVPEHVGDHLEAPLLLAEVAEAGRAPRREEVAVERRDGAHAGDAVGDREVRVPDGKRRPGAAGVEDVPQADADGLVVEVADRGDRVGEQPGEVGQIVSSRRPGV